MAKMVAIRISRRWLQQKIHHADDLIARPVLGGSGLGALFSSFVLTLSKSAYKVLSKRSHQYE